MSETPLLSFVVLSYNYSDYIAVTIRSILDQTVQDFEVVVVDDASRDGSVEVVRSFSDPRIRVLVNDRNLGGAASYNRAVEAARGEWLVNVDADDWIAPNKAEVQLAATAADHDLDIVGSWVSVVAADGGPHSRAPELEANINQPHDFGRVDTWIGANLLCRSSTMVRRSAHHRVGLDDPAMVFAPDYELDPRAPDRLSLRARAREADLLPAPATAGISYTDPVGTLLEMSYAMLRNLMPIAEERALLPSYERMVRWLARNANLSALRPIEAHRLLGLMILTPTVKDFTSFRALLGSDESDPLLAQAGRRCLALAGVGCLPLVPAEPPGFWRQQSEAWEHAHATLVTRLAEALEATADVDAEKEP